MGIKAPYPPSPYPPKAPYDYKSTEVDRPPPATAMDTVWTTFRTSA